MTDLVKLWSRHHARLRKHLPKDFEYSVLWTAFLIPERNNGALQIVLTDECASIFLEHAARRVLDEAHKIDRDNLEVLAYALDTLFPEDSAIDKAAKLAVAQCIVAQRKIALRGKTTNLEPANGGGDEE